MIVLEAIFDTKIGYMWEASNMNVSLFSKRICVLVDLNSQYFHHTHRIADAGSSASL